MHEQVIAKLLERCRRDHAAWINGDGSGYSLPDDGSILGAVGGWSLGGAETASRQSSVARQWESGRGQVEYINGAVSGELAWLTFIERGLVVFRGDTTERRWDLRVTEVFRRSGDQWERVHRHADPLVERRTVGEVADLFGY